MTRNIHLTILHSSPSPVCTASCFCISFASTDLERRHPSSFSSDGPSTHTPHHTKPSALLLRLATALRPQAHQDNPLPVQPRAGAGAAPLRLLLNDFHLPQAPAYNTNSSCALSSETSHQYVSAERLDTVRVSPPPLPARPPFSPLLSSAAVVILAAAWTRVRL